MNALDFHAACAATAQWPLPGHGSTLRRWSMLSALAARDLVLGRLVEAHADAAAILSELEGSALPVGSRWGVWAAEGRHDPLIAQPMVGGTRLVGTKSWCSGATLLTHALVTATHAGTRQLYAVDLRNPGVLPDQDRWASAGMKAADTRSVRFADVPADPVGTPGEYLRRPGFWIGGIGVAACWYGGTAAVAALLRARVARAGDDPLLAAHLGAVDVLLGGARDCLRAAAAEIDDSPKGDHARLARRVRSTVAQAADAVTGHLGRALGPEPLAADRDHAQRVADLTIYVRQDHAERDLAALGLDVAAADCDWRL